jgi:SAM-dependent methyltransferase
MANGPGLSDSARTYRELTERLLSQHPEETAMSLAVGGQFHSFGVLMRQVLMDAGLRSSDYLIDVGCGSGRLSHTLAIERYLGTDVVPDLLAYARSLCTNPAWRFALVNDISIPEADGAADMVCLFSVFTHLLHEDSYRYLLEAHRVLKPGGTVVFSFLEFRVHCTWTVFSGMVDARCQGAGHPHNQFIGRDAIECWASHAGFRIDAFFDGDVPHIVVSEPLTSDDGRVIEGKASFGQSVCVLSK